MLKKRQTAQKELSNGKKKLYVLIIIRIIEDRELEKCGQLQ